MAEDKTIRERVAILEDNIVQIKNSVKDYNGIEDIYKSFIEQLAKTNNSIDHLTEKVDKMYPIVNEVVLVKGYGSFTWRLLKWIGGITLTVITTWHFIKDSISHFFHYIFNN